MIKFLTSQFSGYLSVILIIVGIGVAGWLYWYGWSECKEDQIVKEAKEVVKHEERKTEIRRLGDDELIKRYCASSVFDIPYEKCVREVTYVE